VSLHQEGDLGDPFDWAQRVELLADEAMDATLYWDDKDPLLHGRRRGREPAIREKVHPSLVKYAQTAQFLANKGEVLTAEAMTAFLDEVMDLYWEACSLLERRAKGDYTPDPLPRSFPSFDRRAPEVTSGLTAMQVFTAYIPAAELADGSVRRWRPVFRTLDAHLEGCSVDSLSEREAQQWVASLVTKKRTAFTVMNSYVPALRAVCSWAVQQGLISSPRPA
jgi:hypothetical protein